MRRRNRQQVVMHWDQCLDTCSAVLFVAQNVSIRSLSAEVAKPHQWNVKETTAFPRTTVGPSCFKCLYIKFDNDNDRSYRRPSITVIIQNTLRVRCIGVPTDIEYIYVGVPDDHSVNSIPFS